MSAPHTPSQKYLSTRGGTYDLSFEEAVLKGLASDGGLFIPEEIPTLPEEWSTTWPNLSFQELAFRLISLYVSPSEIPSNDLRAIVERSYSSFRAPEITPTVTLDEERQLYLLELFHGPTFAFKDVALQFLGNLFEYFLVRQNKGKAESDRQRLTVVGATSGDTGSAAIYGLRGKQDVSVFIMFPTGKVSPIQEAQMTTVLDENVHCLSVDGTFDDCQDFVKTLFADPDMNSTHKLAAVNSINWARILAQITYYFYSYGTLLRSGRFSPGQKVRFVVPTGNFGDILAGYFAKRMGLPIQKLVVSTNENDILHRFWQSGSYEKKPVKQQVNGGGFKEDGAKAHADGVKETLSPAMDILVSSNFERLLWYLAYDIYGRSASNDSVQKRRQAAGAQVKGWLDSLKSHGGFAVDAEILKAAQADFESERVSDEETLATIKQVYSVRSPAAAQESSTGTDGVKKGGSYILDPHSAIGYTAAQRSEKQRASAPDTHHISLATAHPAKFSSAVQLALKDVNGFHFNDLLPEQFRGLEELPRRVVMIKIADGLASLRSNIRSRAKGSGNSSVK